jgi:hypothetical protein
MSDQAKRLFKHLEDARKFAQWAQFSKQQNSLRLARVAAANLIKS